MPDKFPTLTMFRVLYYLGGLAIIGGGLYLAVTAAQDNFGGDFDFTIFGTIFAPAFFLGSTMMVTSESINVLLRIEDHLDFLKESQKKNQQTSIIEDLKARKSNIPPQ